MDAALHTYPAGAIVKYQCPLSKEAALKVGLPASHPVLIVSRPTFPTTHLQVMIVSSQIQKYAGYRIYFNTTDLNYRRHSVVCCNMIHSINRRFLHEIVGFVSPDFLAKCLKAYSYEIGLSDEVPPYYQEDPTLAPWFDAGEPNVPTKSLLQEKLDACGLETLTAAISDMPSDKIRGTHMPSVPGRTIGINEDIGMSAQDPAAKKVVIGNEWNGRSVNPAIFAGILPPPKPEKAPPSGSNQPPKQPALPPTMPKRRSWTTFCKEAMDLIEACVPEPIKKNDIVEEAYAKLTQDELYEIWMRRIGPSELVRRGRATSPYYADLLLRYTLCRLHRLRERLIEGIRDHSINLQCLSDTYMVPFRIMRTSDLKAIRMGLNSYEKWLGQLDIDLTKSYISEQTAAGLLDCTTTPS